MPQQNVLSRSLAAFVQDNTLVAVIELSLSSWLIAGVVPGIDRQPLKKLEPDETELLQLLQRWRDEATIGGCTGDQGGRQNTNAVRRGHQALDFIPLARSQTAQPNDVRNLRRLDERPVHRNPRGRLRSRRSLG